MEKFYYLKNYVGHNDLKGTYFIPLNSRIIEKQAKRLPTSNFPEELKSFYSLIGHGILSCGIDHSTMRTRGILNEILPPNIAVDYMLGIIEHPDDDAYYMSKYSYEDMEPGDLPFFEIGNGSSFMVMKLNSDNPNAVWYMGVEKIEDSFERFIWRLYHEGPDYYTKNW